MKDITDIPVKDLLPSRDGSGHKGTYGTAVIVAGSSEITGAQVLCADAARRSGVGIVRVYAPAESVISSRINLPSAVISVFPDTPEETVRIEQARLKDNSSYAIGPGVNPSDDRITAMLCFLISRAPSLVIDATAIRMIASAPHVYMPLLRERAENGLQRAILTPHAGELSDFLKVPVEDQKAMTDKAYEDLPCITVAKFGADTYIIDPGNEIYAHKKPNAGMGKGGSGDVLTGLITGFAAQGLSPLDAAICGVRVHGEAGSQALSRFGAAFMQPEDVINCLKYVYEGTGNGK